MGLSTFNIPTHFLAPGTSGAFFDWIASIPCAASAKRSIVSTWSKATGHSMTRTDWQQALRPRQPETDHAP